MPFGSDGPNGRNVCHRSDPTPDGTAQERSPGAVRAFGGSAARQARLDSRRVGGLSPRQQARIASKCGPGRFGERTDLNRGQRPRSHHVTLGDLGRRRRDAGRSGFGRIW
jgi:hypothetical protein